MIKSSIESHLFSGGEPLGAQVRWPPLPQTTKREYSYKAVCAIDLYSLRAKTFLFYVGQACIRIAKLQFFKIIKNIKKKKKNVFKVRRFKKIEIFLNRLEKQFNETKLSFLDNLLFLILYEFIKLYPNVTS